MEIYAKQCSTYDLQIRCTLEKKSEKIEWGHAQSNCTFDQSAF